MLGITVESMSISIKDDTKVPKFTQPTESGQNETSNNRKPMTNNGMPIMGTKMASYLSLDSHRE